MGLGAKIAIAISILGDVIVWIIVIRSLLSWFPLSPSNPIVRIADALIEPIVAPFRALLSVLIKKPMMIDFSPLLAMIAIYYIIVPVLQNLVLRIFI